MASLCVPDHSTRREEVPASRSVDGHAWWSTRATCGAFWPCLHVSCRGYAPGEAYRVETARR